MTRREFLAKSAGATAIVAVGGAGLAAAVAKASSCSGSSRGLLPYMTHWHVRPFKWDVTHMGCTSRQYLADWELTCRYERLPLSHEFFARHVKGQMGTPQVIRLPVRSWLDPISVAARQVEWTCCPKSGLAEIVYCAFEDEQGWPSRIVHVDLDRDVVAVGVDGRLVHLPGGRA